MWIIFLVQPLTGLIKSMHTSVQMLKKVFKKFGSENEKN
jgi:hypothetical protein